MFFEWAEKQGFIPMTPVTAESIAAGAGDSLPTRPTYLTAEEVKALLAIAGRGRPHDPPWVGVRDATLLLVLATMGLRISEAVSLTMDQVVLAQTTGQLMVVGKGRRARAIPLRPETDVALTSWFSVRPAVETAACFVSQVGRGPISARAVQRRILLYAAEANIRKTTGTVTPHKLRHSYATQLLDNGVDIRDLQELLGHAHRNTTEIYTYPGHAAPP
jgi:integrase/recombinase XerC